GRVRSVITANLTYAAQMVAQLLQQFKGKPKFAALLQSYAAQIQAVENALIQVIGITDIETVVGVQLDTIGLLINQPRNGQSDDVYRLFLKAKIQVLTSQGTIDQLILIIQSLVDPGLTIKVAEDGAAEAIINIGGIITTYDNVAISQMVI